MCACVHTCVCVCAPFFPTRPSDRDQIWHACIDKSGNREGGPLPLILWYYKRNILNGYISYSRTPILRPPSKSDWSGRKRGVVVHEGLDYFITCTLVGTRVSNTVLTVSSTLRTSFAECIAERWTTQRPIRYGVFRHARTLPV